MSDGGPVPATMSRPRRLLVNLVIAAILAGQGAAIVLDRELWPFSPYPMFSTAQRGPVVSRLWLYGVLPGGREVALTDRAAFLPLRLAQIEGGLGRLAPEGLREGLGDLLARYEARRREGGHAGPPIEGLRLYRMTFEIDALAASRDRPLSRELLAEAPAEAR